MVSGFGPPEPVKKAAWRSASGRVCDRQGCSTILSTYNALGTCWLHTEPAYQHPLYRA
jgi:hypothetical protein